MKKSTKTNICKLYGKGKTTILSLMMVCSSVLCALFSVFVGDKILEYHEKILFYIMCLQIMLRAAFFVFVLSGFFLDLSIFIFSFHFVFLVFPWFIDSVYFSFSRILILFLLCFSYKYGIYKFFPSFFAGSFKIL